MEFFIRAMGVKRVQTKFDRMGAAAIDARPVMNTIADLIMAIEKQVFNSQGRRGGGSWKRDSPAWLERKLRNGLDPRINHATEALRASMTERRAEGQVLEISRNSLIFGSELPQAGPSQKNRPFLKFTPRDRLEMRRMLRDYLMAAWKSA